MTHSTQTHFRQCRPRRGTRHWRSTSLGAAARPVVFDAFRIVRNALILIFAAVLIVGWLVPVVAAAESGSGHDDSTLSVAAAGQSARYAPISPVRVVDTRIGRGAAVLSPGQGAQVQLITPAVRAAAGAGTITAAVVNVTAVNTVKGGFVTIWGTGQRPDSSSLNASGPGQTIANLVTTPVAADGSAQVFHDAGGHFLIDVTGVFVAADSASAGRFVPLGGSKRIVDTRSGAPLAAHSALRVDLVTEGVPRDATAAVFNLTVHSAQRPGFATVWPSETAVPESSNLNFASGVATANQVYTALNGGRFDLLISNTAHVIVDLAGYFTGPGAPAGSDGLFVAVAPIRLLDTRNANGPTSGLTLPARQALAVAVGGRHGLPTSGISGIALNTTLTSTAAPGWAVNFPAGTTRPETSSVNASRSGQTVANHVVVGISGDGVSVYSDMRTHVLMDITGYFTGTTPSAPAPTPPIDPNPGPGDGPSEPPTRGSHAFLYQTSVGPARWNPCQPIRYVVDAQYATPAQRELLHQAIDAAAEATGFTFVHVADITNGQNIWRDRNKPNHDADAFFVFGRTGITPGFEQSGIAGWGGGAFGIRRGRPYVAWGYALVNADVADPRLHYTVWLHEIGHMLGLDHVPDRNEIMYPVALGRSTYGDGDREGLWHLGAAQGCIEGLTSEQADHDVAPDEDLEIVFVQCNHDETDGSRCTCCC